MNEFVHSFESNEISQASSLKVKKVLNKGAFNLTKFVLNNPEALVRLPEPDVVRINSTKRILGVHWGTNDDTIFVKTQIKHDFRGKNMTFRRMLSSIATIFAPLGFPAPFVITMKIMLQVIWNFTMSTRIICEISTSRRKLLSQHKRTAASFCQRIAKRHGSLYLRLNYYSF